MSTSGTTAFAPDFSDLLEEAASRAGVEIRGGYAYQSAMRSANLLLVDLANRGLNLFSIDSGNISLSSGDGQYDFPSDTVDVLNLAVRVGGNDIPVERIGVGSWAAIANKTQAGRPMQGWVERLTGVTRVNLWPVPDATYTLYYWRLRRLQDAGNAANTPDVPPRFVPSLISGLAYFLALKKDPMDQVRVQWLRDMYETDLQRAQVEDRGRESFYVGIYTRQR